MASSTKHIYNMEITSTRNLHIHGPWQEQVPKHLHLISTIASTHHPPPSSFSPQQRLLCKTGHRAEQNGGSSGFCAHKMDSNSSSYLCCPTQNPHQTNPEFSDHEGILILQLFKLFNLLSQKEYPAKERKQRETAENIKHKSRNIHNRVVQH